MATLYTRIYTYTGMGKWTASERSVPWSSFKESGDTDHAIGQIVSIRYEHYHASGSSRTWALSGRITHSGGAIVSDSVSSYISGNSDVVKYVNSFETLPTLSQFNSIESVETLAGGSSASNGVLTWTARSTHPLRVIVGFYEEPPWVYHPQIEVFSLVRGTAAGVQDDSGTRALLTLRLSLASAAYASMSSLKLYYAAGEVSTASPSVNLSAYVSSLLSGVTNNYTYITTAFDTDFDWNFLLVFTCGDESAAATAALPNDFVALHISPCSTGGVAIGDLSNATEGNPRFEVHHPSFFYEGIGNLQCGWIEALGNTEGGAYQDGSVTFPRAFASPPVVVIGFSSASTAGSFGRCCVSVMEVTETGFSFRFFNGDSGNRNPKYSYMAFGTPAP